MKNVVEPGLQLPEASESLPHQLLDLLSDLHWDEVERREAAQARPPSRRQRSSTAGESTAGEMC